MICMMCSPGVKRNAKKEYQLPNSQKAKDNDVMNEKETRMQCKAGMSGTKQDEENEVVSQL